MLQLDKVSFAYGSTSIDYPDWSVEKGNHALILGNSGSGKTTLLHLIGGLMPPKKGTIILDGENINEFSKRSMDHFRGENIGIVFQKPHLVRSLTVKENVLLSQFLGKRSTNGRLVDQLLDQLGVLPLKDRKVHQISQGQAQRVSIARAIINSPKLLLADEPTASLDDQNCTNVVQLLKKQASETGATLIVATHDHRVKNEFQNQLIL